MPTKSEKDDFADETTTGHEWDGIQEYDNPLPRWWLWVFYATIVWAVGYWILYPTWPLLNSFTPGVVGFSQRAELQKELAAAKEGQAVYLTKLAKTDIRDIAKDKNLLDFAIAGGRSAFGLNCSQCHGSGAQGAVGFPNLNDDDWLWGGDLETIQETIRVGIRANNEDTRVSDMPAFLEDEVLNRNQISDVAEYVLSLSGKADDAQAAKRGAEIFAENCAACHGDDGGGTQELGAPRLNDAIWLYGSDKNTIVRTISYSRRGVMPSWEGKLDDVTIKELAIYVHSLGGGQ